MVRWKSPVWTLACVFLLALVTLPHGAAETDDAWIRAGDDPRGDARNDIAPGAAVDAVVTSDRTDILALDFQETEDKLLVRLVIGAAPGGTGGYMYRALFTKDEKAYYTCYATQWTGGQAAATQDNTLGCSRFGGSSVGPVSRAGGITIETVEYDGADRAAIVWPVAKTALGEGPLGILEQVTSESWFRGVSNCCVGSTTQTQYMWNRADQGPDEGVWRVDLTPVPTEPIVVRLQADATNLTIEAGTIGTFTLDVTLLGPLVNGTTYPIVLSATGLDDWTHTFSPTNLSLGIDQTRANVTLNITVSLARTPATIPFNVTACIDGSDGCTTIGLAFTVRPPPSTPPTFAASPTITPSDGPLQEDAGLPAPSLLIVVTLLVGLLAWSRRARRGAI